MNPGDLVAGKYRLLRLLGSGGMGSVWAARNELTDRDFAIKCLLPTHAKNQEALQRFFQEARACGQIKHPAIVEVYDMGQAEDGSPFLVMELLEGEGFDQRLARLGPFAAADAAAWLAFVARGLAEAHARGLIHRDLKPGNVFFTLDSRGDVIPKLLDFGVAKGIGVDTDFFKTITGAVVGSPAYMSPEQAQGEVVIDARSDVWSLGVILYEALTGEPPFDAPNYNALMVAIMMRAHIPVAQRVPDVDPELAQIVDQALVKERDKRIATAEDLAERLEAVAARLTGMPLSLPRARLPSIPVVAAPRAGSTTQGPWSGSGTGGRRSNPVVVFASAVIAVALLGGGITYATRRQPLVSIAGRSATHLETSLDRAHEGLVAARDAAAAEERARQARDMVLQMSEIPTAPPAKPSAPTRAPATGKGKKPPAKGGDAHGGVDSAGF